VPSSANPQRRHRLLVRIGGRDGSFVLQHTGSFDAQHGVTPNDYDGPGMNHLAIGANYLTERRVALLFETPRHRPEFAEGEAQTYYQVMFASLDRIMLEVVYTGPKSA